MPPLTQIKLPLVLKDRLILREGRWNGIFYPAEELKPLVAILNDIPKAVREAEHDGRDVEAVKLRNATSLFWDHDEKCENWLGDVRNFRWDDKLRGIRGDLYLVDQEAARKVKYQEARGFTSWGLSPSVMVDKSRNTASNISFNNIAVVLEPAGGVQLMLSAKGPREEPSENGGRPMAKSKKKKDLEKDDDATKDEDTKKDDDEKEEDSTKEKETPSGDAASEEEDLEDVDFDSEEKSEDEGEEELEASTDDILAAVSKLTVIVGALAAAIKKGNGFGNPGDKKPEDEEQGDEGLAKLDREALLEIASKVTKEAKVLENEDELTESVLRDFLTRVASFLPGAEEMASDGDDDEDDGKEDKDADSKEDDEKKEDDEEKEDDSDSDSEEEEEKKSDKGEKKDMAAILKSEFARTRQDLRKEINKAVKAELSRRIRPKRKGRVDRDEENLKRAEKKREDLQSRIKDEKNPEKRLEMVLEDTIGGGE